MGGDGAEQRTDTLGAGPGGSDAELAELGARVSALESDLDAKVTDLRERVIQVKREADEKAPRDHEHPAFTSAAGADDVVSDLAESLSTLESRVDAGFGNYEDVLEHLVDAAEEADGKLDALASAVVDLRRRLAAVERADAEQTAAAELKREANRAGLTDADCEACGESVALALLDAPSCPHCGETFDGVRGRRGLLPFGSATLTTGRRPALERPADRAEAEPDWPEATFGVEEARDADGTEADDSSDAEARAADDGPRRAAEPPETGGE